MSYQFPIVEGTLGSNHGRVFLFYKSLCLPLYIAFYLIYMSNEVIYRKKKNVEGAKTNLKVIYLI